jgi:hypothetical protein
MMSTVKKVLGDYTIQSVSPLDNININTNTVTINGNMVVNGVTTTIDSQNTTVYDNIITLNGNVGPGTTPTLNAGLEVNRGIEANVQLRWDEVAKSWQITVPGDPTTYANIAIALQGGGIQLSANLDMKTFALYSAQFDKIYFDTNVAIKNSTFTPGAVPGYQVIYTSEPIGARDSGLYVTNTVKQNTQIATKNQALFYSLIFS